MTRIKSLLIISLCFCVTIIKSSVIHNDNGSNHRAISDDALVIEPQLFINSTEPVLLGEDEDVHDDDTPVKYNGAMIFRISYDDQLRRNAVAELQESFGNYFDDFFFFFNN